MELQETQVSKALQVTSPPKTHSKKRMSQHTECWSLLITRVEPPKQREKRVYKGQQMSKLVTPTHLPQKKEISWKLLVSMHEESKHAQEESSRLNLFS